jgi:rRNA-processing protein FCF1
VNIKEQIPKYLGDEVKIVTTRCCILELEVLLENGASELFGALQILKQFPLHECGHGKKGEERQVKEEYRALGS